jgi:hypothetical protein
MRTIVAILLLGALLGVLSPVAFAEDGDGVNDIAWLTHLSPPILLDLHPSTTGYSDGEMTL